MVFHYDSNRWRLMKIMGVHLTPCIEINAAVVVKVEPHLLSQVCNSWVCQKCVHTDNACHSLCALVVAQVRVKENKEKDILQTESGKKNMYGKKWYPSSSCGEKKSRCCVRLLKNNSCNSIRNGAASYIEREMLTCIFHFHSNLHVYVLCTNIYIKFKNSWCPLYFWKIIFDMRENVLSPSP